MTIEASQTDYPRGSQLSYFIAHAYEWNIPPVVFHEAKRALIDHLAVAIGAVNDEAVQAVRQVAKSWNATGDARIFWGQPPPQHLPLLSMPPWLTPPILMTRIPQDQAIPADHAGRPLWLWRRFMLPVKTRHYGHLSPGLK